MPALLSHGLEGCGLVRDVKKAQAQAVIGPTVTWIAGDVMRAEDVARAAVGVSTIVHAVNPPGYANWDRLVLPMLDNTIVAARALSGARVVLPGTIYNYDPSTTPVITEHTLLRPQSRKGAIHVEMDSAWPTRPPMCPR